jgi:hypothetical protein
MVRAHKTVAGQSSQNEAAGATIPIPSAPLLPSSPWLILIQTWCPTRAWPTSTPNQQCSGLACRCAPAVRTQTKKQAAWGAGGQPHRATAHWNILRVCVAMLYLPRASAESMAAISKSSPASPHDSLPLHSPDRTGHGQRAGPHPGPTQGEGAEAPRDWTCPAQPPRGLHDTGCRGGGGRSSSRDVKLTLHHPTLRGPRLRTHLFSWPTASLRPWTLGPRGPGTFGR